MQIKGIRSNMYINITIQLQLSKASASNTVALNSDRLTKSHHVSAHAKADRKAICRAEQLLHITTACKTHCKGSNLC